MPSAAISPSGGASPHSGPKRTGRRRLILVLAVLLVIAGVAAWWTQRADSDADLPSVEDDRLALERAVADVASANSLTPSPEDSATVAGLDLVESRGRCGEAPQDPAEERAGVVRAFAPSDPLSPLPVSAAVGAFSFSSASDAEEFVGALGENIEACAPGSVTATAAPSTRPDALARQVGVPFGGIEVPLRLVSDRSGRFVVVVAGLDVAQVDAVAEALRVDLAS